MAITGKPNSKGRSSGILNGRNGKHMKPPQGEPWMWQTLEFLLSPALRACSIQARWMLDFLHAEHCFHGGQENGQLKATYDQLAAFGIPRKYIRATIYELEHLGLLEVTHTGGRDNPSTYRLRHLPTLNKSPTNEWKRITTTEAKAVSEMVQQLRQRARGQSGSQFTIPNAGTVLRPNAGTAKAAPRRLRVV